MLGFLITVLFAGGAATVGAAWLARAWPDSDPAERVGIGMLVVLGGIGWVTFFLGLIPGGVRWVPFPWLLLALGLLPAIRRGNVGLLWRFQRPQGSLFAVVGLGVLAAFVGLVNTLAPSTMLDWDTLAYHLAVPKIWIREGLAEPIPFIHHSHFPFAVDNLYLWGLQWGGESGAKAFTWALTIAGALAMFGAVRRRFGANVAPWAALGWFGAPLVLWQAGSGYIDVVHGLFAGFAAIYLAERVTALPERVSDRAPWWLIGALLGLAIGSKYTGLQTAALLAPLALLAGFRSLGAIPVLKGATVVVLVALAVGGPWYVRNAVVAKNPVYPFFYERLGGANWDQWRADIYRDEQQTFGVGRTPTGRDLSALPHAVLGLGYQPGRYINPNQTQGGGFPMGALGLVLTLSWPLWLVAGRSRSRPEATFLAIWVGLSFALWMVLSQQARYILALAPALLWLLASLPITWRRVLPTLASVQVALTLALLVLVQTRDQLPVALGAVDREAYRAQRVPFAAIAPRLNQLGPQANIALFDEVFGFLLDVPYFWANPGHGRFIPYETIDLAKDWVKALQDRRISHVYVNLSYTAPADRTRWLQAMGLEPGGAWTAEERARMDADPNLKWKRLLADAVRERRLMVRPESTRSQLVLELMPVLGN